MCHSYEMVQPPSHTASLAFLLSQVGAQSARLFASELTALGVAPRGYGVLSSIAATGGQTQQELADALGIHRNNMVSLIDDLEAAGLVQRHKHSRDRRAFTIRLTDEGADVVRRVAELLPDLDSRIGRGLAKHQRELLIDLLKHIAHELGLHPGVHPHLSARG
jgi:DNA-binding MarR family transcriptional regulator